MARGRRQAFAFTTMYGNVDMHSKHINEAFTSCLSYLTLIVSIYLGMSSNSGVFLFVEGLLYG